MQQYNAQSFSKKIVGKLLRKKRKGHQKYSWMDYTFLGTGNKRKSLEFQVIFFSK